MNRKKKQNKTTTTSWNGNEYQMNENVHDVQRATRSCESKNKNRSKFNPCGKKCSSSAALFAVVHASSFSYFDSHSNSKEKRTAKNKTLFFIAN